MGDIPYERMLQTVNYATNFALNQKELRKNDNRG